MEDKRGKQEPGEPSDRTVGLTSVKGRKGGGVGRTSDPRPAPGCWGVLHLAGSGCTRTAGQNDPEQLYQESSRGCTEAVAGAWVHDAPVASDWHTKRRKLPPSGSFLSSGQCCSCAILAQAPAEADPETRYKNLGKR